jgi:hypothetical protein
VELSSSIEPPLGLQPFIILLLPSFFQTNSSDRGWQQSKFFWAAVKMSNWLSFWGDRNLSNIDVDDL